MSKDLLLEFVEELPEVEFLADLEVEDILDQLKARPGQWALVKRNAYEQFHRRFPGAEFYKVRGTVKGKHDVYLRWPDGSTPIRDLVWEEPPTFAPNQEERRKYTEETIRALRQHPGRWAIVEKWEGDGNTTRRDKWKRRGAEARVRTKGSTAYLYARWPENA